MHFMVGFPRTLGNFDAIWVIVDRLSKSAHLIHVHTTYILEKLNKIYIRDKVRFNRVQISIISYCGTQLTSLFWWSMQKGLGTQVELRTTFNP